QRQPQQFRTRLLQQPLEDAGPVCPRLSIQQLLSGLDIVDAGQGVVATGESDSAVLKLTAKPFSTVDANMHRERQPRLNSHVTQPQHRMQEIQIPVQAFAERRSQIELFCLEIT